MEVLHHDHSSILVTPRPSTTQAQLAPVSAKEAVSTAIDRANRNVSRDYSNDVLPLTFAI